MLSLIKDKIIDNEEFLRLFEFAPASKSSLVDFQVYSEGGKILPTMS